MYRMREAQITIDEFLSPFGQLDQTNRWVKKAKLIPWHRIEEKYANLFESDTGNVGPTQQALISRITHHRDLLKKRTKRSRRLLFKLAAKLAM